MGRLLTEYHAVIFIEWIPELLARHWSIVPFPDRYRRNQAVTGETVSLRRGNVRVILHNHYRSQCSLASLGKYALKDIASIVFEAQGIEANYTETETGLRLGLKRRNTDE